MRITQEMWNGQQIQIEDLRSRLGDVDAVLVSSGIAEYKHTHFRTYPCLQAAGGNIVSTLNLLLAHLGLEVHHVFQTDAHDELREIPRDEKGETP